jgi:sporulation integral membrane protein YtvI
MPGWLQRTLFFLLRTSLAILGLFLVLKLLRFTAPFLLAFLFSTALEPVVRFLKKRVRIPRKLGAIISILLVLGTIGTLLGLIVTRLVLEIRNLYDVFSTSFVDMTAFFNRMMDQAAQVYIRLPKEVTDAIDNSVTALGTSLKDILGRLAEITLKVTVSVPEAVIFLLVTILATYFMISDRVRINAAFEKWVPKSWLKNTRHMVVDVFKALFGWLRAQGIIMSITFSIILTGLLLAGIDNPLVIALLTAVIDALPVFGAGAILIPWGIALIVTGNVKLGIFLLILDGVILIVRHLIEPRIVGRQIGIHPLLTLLGMYLGLQWIGVLGMILGPICMVLLKAILDGVLKMERFTAFVSHLFRESNLKTESVAGRGEPAEVESASLAGMPIEAVSALFSDRGPFTESASERDRGPHDESASECDKQPEDESASGSDSPAEVESQPRMQGRA